MKFFYLTLSLAAAVTALTLTGCGKNNDNSNSTPAVVGAPATTSTVPVGCYYNQFTGYYGANMQCQPCPTGYTESGTTCVLNNGATPNCPSGTWTGYSCQPSGFSCPTSTAFSYQYGGCLGTGTTYPTYNGYQCAMTGPYSYVCYFTGNYYTSGYSYYYYYNGYTWMRRYY
jgi:hypothetical protein